MLEIKLEKQLPVVTINFAEVKTSIQQAMEKYNGLVVTEEELPGCKATQKQLAGYRNKLDTYRKDVKKEMTKPITDFENQCKELIGLVTDAESPIKEGIEVFNEKIRENKRTDALAVIFKTAIAQGLNEKYANQLTVLDKYTMLSAKAKDTLIDIEQRAFILLQEQDREIEQIRIEKERVAEALRLENERIAELKVLEEKRQIELVAAEEKRKKEFEASEILRIAENLQIAINTIEQANTQIKQQISVEDYMALINSGATAMTIIQEINKKKARIILLETPVIEPVIVPVVEIKEEPIELPFTDLEPSQTPTEPTKMYFIEMRVEGTLEEITSLSKFLKDNNYNYNAKDKGRV